MCAFMIPSMLTIPAPSSNSASGTGRITDAATATSDRSPGPAGGTPAATSATMT